MSRVLIIGAGHNGLTAAAYLARSGCAVTVLERRAVVGGACVTEELIPGARFSTCAFVCSSLRPEIIADLELERHGLDTYTTDVLNFLMAPSGDHLFLWPELDRTLREIDRISKHDGQAYVDFGLRFRRFADHMRPYLLQQPPCLSEVIKGFEDSGEIDLWHEFTTISVGDLVDRYFDTDLLKGLFLHLGQVAIHAGPYSPGTAYEFGHHSWGEYKGEFGRFGFVRGGMGGITQALAAASREAGVEIATGSAVQRILIKGGRAVGVELSTGDRIDADIVVSNADPVATYTNLLDGTSLSRELKRHVNQIDVRGSMGRVHLLVNTLPEFRGLDSGEGPQHRGFILLGGMPEEFERCWQAQSAGELADDYPIEMIIQSVADRSVCAAGYHTITTGLCQLPFELRRGSWETRREEFADRVIKSLRRFVPNIEETIVAHHTLTPGDLANEYGLSGGNIFHGAMVLSQLFDARPIPGRGGYRTPIQSLYLCGAGTHPGGAVMGACGHNAAMAVLADLGLKDDPGPAQSSRIQKRELADRLGRTEWLTGVRDWAVRRRTLRPLVRGAARTRRKHN